MTKSMNVQDVDRFSLEADLRWLLWSLRGERDDGYSLVHSGTFAFFWNRVTEWWEYAYVWGIIAQKYGQQGS